MIKTGAAHSTSNAAPVRQHCGLPGHGCETRGRVTLISGQMELAMTVWVKEERASGGEKEEMDEGKLCEKVYAAYSLQTTVERNNLKSGIMRSTCRLSSAV